jgi:hypothetical protein
MFLVQIMQLATATATTKTTTLITGGRVGDFVCCCSSGPGAKAPVALQPLGVLYTLYTPRFLDVPTVAARCLHVLSDARDPSSERWNFMGEKE